MDFYHILNRGVDKRTIFMDKRDYYRFIYDLFLFNDVANVDTNRTKHFFNKKDVGRPLNERASRRRELLVYIHTFCLMPNHYHLLLSPVADNGIALFMKKLNGGYAKYFNEQYERSGALFQGKYKSVPIIRDKHFGHMPYYIHFNPLDLTQQNKKWRERNAHEPRAAIEFLAKYKWSSHLDYLGEHNFPSVTQRNFLLDYFDGENGYRKSLIPAIKSFSMDGIEKSTLE
jgi:putative transposase